MRLRDAVVTLKPSAELRRQMREGPFPLKVVSGSTPQQAQLAEAAGIRQFSISGSATSAELLGLPDAGLLTLTEVVDNARRVCCRRVDPRYRRCRYRFRQSCRCSPYGRRSHQGGCCRLLHGRSGFAEALRVHQRHGGHSSRRHGGQASLRARHAATSSIRMSSSSPERMHETPSAVVSTLFLIDVRPIWRPVPMFSWSWRFTIGKSCKSFGMLFRTPISTRSSTGSDPTDHGGVYKISAVQPIHQINVVGSIAMYDVPQRLRGSWSRRLCRLSRRSRRTSLGRFRVP